MTCKISLQTLCDLKALDNCESTIAADNSKISMENVYLSTTVNCEDFKSVESPKAIYFNPNYGVQKHVIHVNPKVHAKTSIHINPKLNSKASEQVCSKVGTKTSIFVNPKIVKNIDVMQKLQREESSVGNSAENSEPNTLQMSVYVNPNLLEKLRSTESQKRSILKKKAVTEQTNYNAYSGLNMKNAITNKFTNSIVTPIKLKRFSGAESKITHVNDNILVPSTSRSGLTNNRLKFVKSTTKVSDFSVTTSFVPKGKNISSGLAKTKALSNFMKLVSIGGISYNSSKNQLVRRSSTSPVKKKRIISSKVQDQFFIASNGKALRRLGTTKKCQTQVNLTKMISNLNRTTFFKRISNILLKQNVKSSISNKVKQRSIQVLRNKMRKNNQPCLFFQKFGYCANQAKGMCHKVHDQKQVALCRNFLQEKCLLEHCKLSHDVGPEKMPTCKYFLEGCCTRDACPYLHVKVSENTPICRQFLQGYCVKGNECKQRHMYACPEFEKAGDCSKGKHCPYPHKSKAPKISCILQKRKDLSTSKTPNSTEFACHTVESRKRYYDSYSEDLGKKRERLLKNFKIINVVQAGQSVETIRDNEIIVADNRSGPEQDLNLELERSKRPPMGHLPSYIPIN